MSQGNAEVVRQPLTLRTHTHRRLEERLALRFPRVLVLGARAFSKLPPRSRLRQAILRHALRLAVEAVNRGDYEAAFVLCDPNVELNSPPDMIGLGEPSVTRGLEERVWFQRRWTTQWGEIEFAPKEVADLGDARVMVTGRMRGSGLSSGAAFENEWALLLTLADGRVIREQVFRDHAEALEAAGLSE